MSRASQLRSMASTSDTEADYSYPSPSKLNNSHSEIDSDDHDAADSGYTSKAAGSKGSRHADDDWNYVRRTLAKEKPLPPITLKNVHKNINWISFIVLTVVPSLALYGAFTTKLTWQTAVWSVVYYFYSACNRASNTTATCLQCICSLAAGLGITAGYHRLWAHRAYNASLPLQYFLALGGSGAVEGSIRWWSRGHRAHHRSVLTFSSLPKIATDPFATFSYTDTELDPYSAHKGFWWSHIGWMIFKGRRQPGVADVSDLSANPVVRWQHRWYLPLIVGMGFIFPTAVAGLLWNDWRGGFFFAGAARLLFVHHSTFCVNSLAHWLGDTPFDDKHTPRDHFITALCTVGEGYHNFHHQFPMDYRNAIKW